MKNRGFNSWASDKGTKWKEVFYWVKRCNLIPEDEKMAFTICITDRILNGGFPRNMEKCMPKGFNLFKSNITNNQSAWSALLKNPRGLYNFYKRVKPSTLHRIDKLMVVHILEKMFDLDNLKGVI